MKRSPMAGVALPMVVQGQEPGPGATEFADRCAVCNGATGKGGGMVGEMFAQKPKDLMMRSKENGEAFPFERVYQGIDGRHKFPAHGIGKSPMPIWGTLLEMERIQQQGLTPDLAAAVA